ncbi:DEAD/DEAH box helicase [Prevotella sp. E13-27]|uniref:DEAD/DEAH box helicase n=1 Tax=Prevotella sp. E13-27 TaxID=2938122 RepID=UPI00200A0DEB|nr:DEAD/DEAH box helicase [Prevotella sp. E13-27]MCK8623393.1 DEAD/DEAH box helicase [Prevotella sp. E13-27]
MKGLEKLGIAELNSMQQEAYDAILRTQNDVLILSPTGSGKTLAYLLPLVELIDANNDNVQALVVVPGRELSLQSDRVLRQMGCGVRSQACYGGRTAMEEHKVLKQNRPQIVFGTPGRINDHLEKGNIDANNIKYLVIDEFDKCLEMGFQNEMSKLIATLPALRRRVLLSATEAEQIPRFVEMKKTQRLDYLDDEQEVSERVEVYEVKSPQKDKLDTLSLLLKNIGEQQSVVFLNYRDSVERVDQYLRQQGFVTSAFHGGLDQRQREDALYKFSNGSSTVLVSTDLASRGLDIPNLENVIHYHLPVNEEALIHRVGRTARWQASGRTFFIVGPEEKIMVEGIDAEPFELNAVSVLPKPIMGTIYIGKGKKDKISKGDIAGFLCKVGGLSSQDIGRIDVTDRYAYVAVRREVINSMLKNVSGQKIKGLKTVVEPVR